MRTVAILQPHYLPWMGYFGLMELADSFVFYDDVQFERQSWQNRNRIRASNGWNWLTVPVSRHFGQKISEVRIDNRKNWGRKHFLTIEQNYAKASYFQTYREGLRAMYQAEWERLLELDLSVAKLIASEMRIETETHLSSQIASEGTGTERLVSICRELRADRYVTGPSAKSYLDEALFARSGIDLVYYHYQHPSYGQLGKGFIPGLSALDLLLNEGEASARIVKAGNKDSLVPATS